MSLVVLGGVIGWVVLVVRTLRGNVLDFERSGRGRTGRRDRLGRRRSRPLAGRC